MERNDLITIFLSGVILTLTALIIIAKLQDEKLKEADQFSVRYVQNYVDPETGVNYIFYHSPVDGNVTISVRYNSEGNVMITPLEKKTVSGDNIDEELVTNG